MISKDELELQARLTAIEYLLSTTIAKLYLMAGATDEDVKAGRRVAAEILSKETIDGLDPAQSDMIAAEIQQQVDRLQVSVLEAWVDMRAKLLRR